MEEQNELAAIFQKRKARSEGTEEPAKDAASKSVHVSHVKAAKSLFESAQTSNGSSPSKKPGVPAPKTAVSATKLTTQTEPKKTVSDIASKFQSANSSCGDGKDAKTETKTAYGRQTSDMPLKSPKSKPLSKIHSSPNLETGNVSASIPEDGIPTQSYSYNVKELKDNLLLTLEQSKGSGAGGLSPGAVSPRLIPRSRSPTPGIIDGFSTPPLRQKNPSVPPKPLGPSGGESTPSEPSSKRSSYGSDKNDDPIGDTFVAALKARLQGSESSSSQKVESSTLPKPAKPNVAKKPQLTKSSPGSPALPPKLAKPSNSGSLNNSVSGEAENTALPTLPARTKKLPKPPGIDTESSADNGAKMKQRTPVKKQPGKRIDDELSRPIPPMKPTVTAQLSSSSDYYDDVDVVEYPPPEGDKDSGRGSTEGGAVDSDKRSSGADSWTDWVDDDTHGDQDQTHDIVRPTKKLKPPIRHRHSGDSRKTTRRQMSPKIRFYSNPERCSQLFTYDEVAVGDSDNWETDEDDEGYEYVGDLLPQPQIEPPSPEGAEIEPSHSLQVAAPTEAVPIRPPRHKHTSPTASHSPAQLGTSISRTSIFPPPNTPPTSRGQKVTPPPPPKMQDQKSPPVRGRDSPAATRRRNSLDKNVPPPTVPRRQSMHSESEGSTSTEVGQSHFATYPRPNTPATELDEPPPVPPARGTKFPVSPAPASTPSVTLTPPSLPPRNKDYKDEPVSPARPQKTPPLTPDTVVPLSPPVTLPRLPPKSKPPALSPSDGGEPRGGARSKMKLTRGEAVDDQEGEPQDCVSNKLLTQVPPPPPSTCRPGSTTESSKLRFKDGYVLPDENVLHLPEKPLVTKDGYFLMDNVRRTSFRDMASDSTDSNCNYIDPLRDLDSHPDANPSAKGTPAPFTELWNEQVPKPTYYGSFDKPYLELLPEEIEEIQAYVAGNLDHHGDSTQFIDEPLYQIYHCGAAARDMQRQSNEGDVDDIYDYEEAASYVTESIYGNLEELDGPAQGQALTEDSTSVFAATMASLVRSGSAMRTLWCEMPKVKESGLLSTLSSEQKKIQEALFEIMTSEASYLKSLNILISTFYESKELCAHVENRDKHTLFSNAVAVRDVSSRFMGALETFWKHRVLIDVALLDLINDFALEPFNVYVIYCSNQIYQERTLRRLKQQNPTFKEVVSRLESNRICQGLPVQSFLTLPMQRITRLPLLIDAVCHRMDASSQEYENATRALQNLQKLVKKCNEGAQQMLSLEKITEIDSVLKFKNVKKIPLVSQSRSLVKEGMLMNVERVKDGKGKAKKREDKYLYLFNDLLIVAKKKSEDSYHVVDYRSRIFVESHMIEDEDIPKWLGPSGPPKDCRNLFLMALLDNNEQKHNEFIFSCKSPSDRMRWIEATTPSQQVTDDERIYEAWDYPQVQAIHKYVASQADELSLEESDVINVFKKISDGWYEGERIRDGQRGWFPANHTMEIESAHVRARNLRQRYRLLTKAHITGRPL